MSPATDTDVDVVMVGGGIRGPANAYGLARDGHRLRVLEQAPALTEVGACLQMAPTSPEFCATGLLDQVIKAGVLPRRLAFKGAIAGEDLSHLHLGDDFVQRYGAPYVVIHRNDLLTILVHACQTAGVELVANSAVDTVRTAGGPADYEHIDWLYG